MAGGWATRDGVIGKVQLVNIYSYSLVFVFDLLINSPEHIATTKFDEGMVYFSCDIFFIFTFFKF
jgi:hypothetical protein